MLFQKGILMKNLAMENPVRFLAPALVLLLAFCAVSAEAQVTGYPGKIICGYQAGNVPLLNNPTPLSPPHPYENFKPGNYATTFNVQNLNATDQAVSFYLALPDLPLVFVGARAVGPFQSTALGCADILNQFIPPLVGQFIEGMLIPVMANGNFVTDVAYTYSSQNAFERHIVYTEEGETQSVLNQTLADILGEFTLFPFGRPAAASGAGGLGLGASIDVERLPGVPISSAIGDVATDEFPTEPEPKEGS